MDPTLRAILSELVAVSMELDRLRVENRQLLAQVESARRDGVDGTPEAAVLQGVVGT